jgi:hypothetical protein
MLKKTDLLWLLGYPLYQIIGTARHEGSHALAAVLHGATLTHFVIWPSFVNERLLWGYVEYTGSSDTWLIMAAPYLIDLLTFTVCFAWLWRVRFARRAVWLNLVIIGLLSPLINSAYNYAGRFSPGNDVARLLLMLPAGLVQGYFILTLLIYLSGVVMIFRTAATHAEKQSPH